jgi:hypothetical protein
MSFGSFTDSDLDIDSESVDSFSFIDKSTLIREVFADRYDGVTDPEDDHSRPTYHQVYVIGEDLPNMSGLHHARGCNFRKQLGTERQQP